MGNRDRWLREAERLQSGGQPGDPIPPPPWEKSTENHDRGLGATRYWQAVRSSDREMGREAGAELLDDLQAQRKHGLWGREALSPTYDVDSLAATVVAWTAATECLREEPEDQVAREIQAQSLGAIRFALGLASELEVFGAVLAPGQRAKNLETDVGWERGLTLLLKWWSPSPDLHPDLARHLDPPWLSRRDAHGLLWALLTYELHVDLQDAGGPTLRGRLSHPLLWRRTGSTLEVYAPWLHVRDEAGGKHGRRGAWAVLEWRGSTRDNAEPLVRVVGVPVPADGRLSHPWRGWEIGGDWRGIGPDSNPWPLEFVTPAPPPGPEEPSERIDPGSLEPEDFDALPPPDKRAALQGIFAVAELPDAPERIIRVRDRLAASIASQRAREG